MYHRPILDHRRTEDIRGAYMIEEVKFCDLPVSEQVDTINELLASGMSITKACKELQTNRGSTSKRLNNNGWIFDGNINQYIQGEKSEQTQTDTTEEKPKNKPKKSVEPKINNKPKTDHRLTLDGLNLRLSQLEQIVKDMGNQVNPATDKTFTPVPLSDDTVIRSYKFDKDVMALLDDLLKQYPLIDKQTAINNLLREVLTGYLK